MLNYAVVRTDNMYGTDVRAGLVSIEYVSSDTLTAIENGNVLKVGALMSHGTAPNISYEREIFVGETPAANDALTDIVLIASPEIVYDERYKALDDFRNEAGKPARGYRLHSGDIFSVTKAALDGAATPAIGDIVELKAGTKLNVVAAGTGATSGSTVVGEIIAIDTVNPYTFYVIRVD